jgi:hypothetical protein
VKGGEQLVVNLKNNHLNGVGERDRVDFQAALKAAVLEMLRADPASVERMPELEGRLRKLIKLRKCEAPARLSEGGRD